MSTRVLVTWDHYWAIIYPAAPEWWCHLVLRANLLPLIALGDWDPPPCLHRAACSATGIFHCHTIQTNMSSSHWVAKLYWKEISERSVWSPSQPSSLLLIITLSSPHSSPCLQGNWFGTRTTFVESLMHCQHFYDVQLLLIWFLPPTKYLFRWTGYIWRSGVTSD